ncbi:MAG: Type secretion system protein [Pseudomonadota bacterium]|jgi:type IV pilus assembly protein PilC
MSTHAAMARALARRAPVATHSPMSTHRIPAQTLAVFTRQWSALMCAGIPLVQAFELLAQSAVGSARTQQVLIKILNQLQQDVSAGCSLHVAFQKHPHTFDTLYCNLLQAGESAGILDKLLNRLADTLEANRLLKAKIHNALIYPTCILAVAFGVVMVILVWVVPQFEEVFQSMGAQLPAPTQLLVSVSRGITQWGWLVLALCAMTGAFFMRAHRRSNALQLWWEAAICQLPIVGALLQSSRTAKWSLTLSALVAAGIPISEALMPAAAASGSPQLQAHANELMRLIQEGSGLSVAMSKSKLFQPVLVQMCAIGEETGGLAELLEKAAQLMVADLNQRVAQLTTLLEPVLMVFLGTVIGGVLIALYLPIFNLGQVF